jgi:hypothetical protein
MSHENYVAEASRSLKFLIINAIAALVFGGIAAAAVFYGTAGGAIVCAVLAMIFFFGASVNMHDFTRNQRRADATRPTHRL